MKKILLSAVSLVVLTGSALAADLPSRKAPVLPPPPPPPPLSRHRPALRALQSPPAAQPRGS